MNRRALYCADFFFFRRKRDNSPESVSALFSPWAARHPGPPSRWRRQAGRWPTRGLRHSILPLRYQGE